MWEMVGRYRRCWVVGDRCGLQRGIVDVGVGK
jgi:hypothetical protein